MSIISNNEISGWGVDSDIFSADAVEQSTKNVQPGQDHRKISLPEGLAQLLVTDKKITLTYKDHGVAVTEGGTIIKGKMHFAADIKDIRINGFWTFNTELLTCLPSTLFTPMPTLKYNTPPFAETVATLITLVP